MVQIPLGYSGVFQKTKAELRTELFLLGQLKRDQKSNMDCSDSQSVNVSNTSNDQTKRRFFDFVSMAANNMTSYLSLIGIIMQERPSKKPNIRIIQLNF